MSGSFRGISQLVGALYEVGVGGEPWNVLGRDFAEVFEVGVGGFGAGSGKTYREHCTFGFDEAILDAYDAHYHRLDPTPTILARRPPMVPVTLDNMNQCFRRSEFFAEVWRPTGCNHLLVAANGYLEGDRQHAKIMVFRQANQAPFDDDDIAAAGELIHHLQRAVRLRERAGIGPSSDRPTLDALRRRFGLTAREAEVAAEVATGASAAEVGLTLGVSRETARTHIKSLFSKTHTHSLSRLTHILLTSGAGEGMPER